LDVEFLDSTTGASLGYGTANGVRQVSAAASYRHNKSKQDDLAPYINVEKSLGSWTFDAGLRREQKKENVKVELPASYNLNAAGQNNPALRNATFGSGTWRNHDYDLSATVWTSGINYQFNQGLSAYGRFVKAYRLPISDDMMEATLNNTFSPGPTERIQQIEAGLKYATRKLSVFATVVQSELQNNAFAGVFAQPDGSLLSQTYYRSTKATGVELEAFYTPIKPLTFHVIGTLQKAEYSSDVFISGVNSAGTAIALNINGNIPVRTPKVYTLSSALYKLPAMRFGQIMANVDWEYVGNRPADDANLAWLGSYNQINAGLSLATQRLTWRVQVKNIFNEVGFTEGDPRTSQLIADTTAAYANYRPLFGRSFLASVTYSF
jgi:outer membrane cobalamin receptor